MQVGRGRGVSGGLGGETRRLGSCFPRGPVRIQRGDALECAPASTVDELPRGIEGRPWPAVIRVGLLEHGQDILGGLGDETRHHSQLVGGQLEVTGHGRHDGHYPIAGRRALVCPTPTRRRIGRPFLTLRG